MGKNAAARGRLPGESVLRQRVKEEREESLVRPDVAFSRWVADGLLLNIAGSAAGSSIRDRKSVV